jgi:hypothetical protein
MVKRATMIPPTVINMNAARARKRGGNQEGGRIGAAIRSGLKKIVTNSGVQRAAASALGQAAAAVGVPQSAIQAGTSFVEGKIQAGEARRAARQTGSGKKDPGQGGAGQEGGAIMRQSRRGMVGGRVSKKAREMGVERLIGTRYQVFDGTAYKTKQGLTKKDFFRRGTRVISLKASQNGKRNIAKNPKMVPFKKGKAA